MNDTILWFIWISAGVILLVLLINTFVVSQSVLKNSVCTLLKKISQARRLSATKHMSLFPQPVAEHGSVYEGYYSGTSRDWFRAVLIDRAAFGRA
jgi:hypothetical protein